MVSTERADDGRIVIVVADTGPGIAAEHHQRAFEPFERLGAERGDVQGTGLGLALSQRLVQAMGGSIKIESDLGQGSTFTVELAAADGPAGDRAARVTPSALRRVIDAPGARHYRILYIEDNLSNLTLIEHILRRQPALKLMPAMQGTIGLELARQHPPDLIVLDLHLPDMSGEDVLKGLKADPSTSTIPVVVLSADAGRRRAEHLIELGAADYLTKPLDVSRFLDVIAGQLGAGVAGQPQRLPE
jgi:CheY-like chemotaxis protein